MVGASSGVFMVDSSSGVFMSGDSSGVFIITSPSTVIVPTSSNGAFMACELCDLQAVVRMCVARHTHFRYVSGVCRVYSISGI